MGGADRRHAVRRRHRAPRPRRRQGGGRARHLPLAARQAAGAARHRRGLARPPRRLAVRRARHGPQGLLDDRLRARQPGAAADRPTRTSSSSRRPSTLGPQPPNFQNIVALNRGPLVKETVDAHPLTPRQVQQAQRRRRARRRRPHRAAVRRGAHPRRGLHHRAARRLRLQARLARRARAAASCSSAATTRTRSRPRRSPAAVGLRNIAGYLAGGMTSWREEKLDVERIERMTVPELHERWERDGDGLQILDVREQASGTPATSPARSTSPTTTSTRSPTASTPHGPSPSSAARASAPRSPPACSSATAPRTSSTSSTAACRMWKREGWPTEQPSAQAERRCCSAIPFGLAIGLAVGTLGGGGSVLAVPVLVYVLGQTRRPRPRPPRCSSSPPARSPAALGHARAGRVCWRHAGSFTAAAVPGIVARHARRRGGQRHAAARPASRW